MMYGMHRAAARLSRLREPAGLAAGAAAGGSLLCGGRLGPAASSQRSAAGAGRSLDCTSEGSSEAASLALLVGTGRRLTLSGKT